MKVVNRYLWVGIGVLKRSYLGNNVLWRLLYNVLEYYGGCLEGREIFMFRD